MAFLYCPECGAEYLPGVLKCADCGVPLVRELPAPRPRDGSVDGSARHDESARQDGSDGPDGEVAYVDLVRVYDGFSLERYLVARSLLESAGIQVFPVDYLQPFHGVSMSPGIFGRGQGAYGLWVRPDAAEDARAVLAEAAESERAPASPDDEEAEAPEDDSDRPR